MRFDFTSILDRRGFDASALDSLGHGTAPKLPKEGFDAIPMWVADMNFPTAPAITEAIIRRASHPAFGYFGMSPEYYAAIRGWHRERNGVDNIPDEAIGYENGVLGGVSAALHVLCPRGGPVLVHTPTYVGFSLGVLRSNGYQIVYSPLEPDEQGVWRMDFDDMERKIRENHIHTAIVCSPHNPCGRVWERWELERMMELYRKYDVSVISDEIWSDLILTGTHIPTQSVSEDARQRTVAVYAPTKTFNLAGLTGSYHIVYNERVRDMMAQDAALSHYNSGNVLSMHALFAAYSEQGAAWVDELRQVLYGNTTYACDFIEANFPGVWTARPQATYMLFLDCTGWCQAHGVTIDELIERGTDVGVAWQDGRLFNGPCHIRMNLAHPLSRVQEAFERLKKYVFVD